MGNGAPVEDPHIVAVLVPNAALSSVLGMVLGAAPGMRVHLFDSKAALAAHTLERRVDLLVYDFDDATGDDLVAALKRRGTQVIALTGTVDRDSRQRAAGAGIDEVIVKPMSPRYLLERVRSRLASRRC